MPTFQNLDFAAVRGNQIVKACCMETGKYPAFYDKGSKEYKQIQDAVNEAREKGLIINPDEYTMFSTKVQDDTSRMKPSEHGWEETKEILRKHFRE